MSKESSQRLTVGSSSHRLTPRLGSSKFRRRNGISIHVDTSKQGEEIVDTLGEMMNDFMDTKIITRKSSIDMPRPNGRGTDKLSLKERFNRANALKLVKRFTLNIKNKLVPQQVPQQAKSIYDNYQQVEEQKIHGWRATRFDVMLLDVISVFTIIYWVFMTTTRLALTIPESGESYGFAVFFVLRIFYKLNTKVYLSHKIILHKDEIRRNYLNESALEDFIALLITMLELANVDCNYIRLVGLLKLRQISKIFQKFENVLCLSPSNQYLWNFLKNFWLNFAMSHLIALVFLEMSLLSDENWIKKHLLTEAPWYEVYIWAYYWATTMVLTVGFGDFVPVNHREAVVITVAEVFGSVVLAYTVSNFGELIRRYNLQDQKKQQSLTIMNRYFRDNNIPLDVQLEVKDSLQQTANLIKTYNVTDQNKVINSLSDHLRAKLLEDLSSRKLKQIGLFSRMSWKFISQIALKLEKRMLHPQGLLIPEKAAPNTIWFLAKGQVSIKANLYRRGKIQISKIRPIPSHFQMIGMYEFCKGQTHKYNYQAADVCTLYTLSVGDLTRVLALSARESEIFCQYRDNIILGASESQSSECPCCPKVYHTLAECPRFHYIPLRSLVLSKQKRKNSNYRSKRSKRETVLSEMVNQSRRIYMNSRFHNKDIQIDVDQLSECDDFEESGELSRNLTNIINQKMKASTINNIPLNMTECIKQFSTYMKDMNATEVTTRYNSFMRLA